MKHLLVTLTMISGIALSSFATGSATENFVFGTPEVQSIHALTFGPEGVLFLGDSKAARVWALATDDTEAPAEMPTYRMDNVDEVLAAQLGVDANEVAIQDMAINPISKQLYLAVHLGDGKAILLLYKGGQFIPVAMENVRYSEVALENAVAEDATDRRGRSLRVWAISDLSFANDQLMVSGLSNQEFASTFRSIPFPFQTEQQAASLEIFHAAHGRFETYAPIKTFTTAEVNGKAHLIASYTCTPLVVWPLETLEPGAHVKGRTVAELGSNNSPLDMVVMNNGGERYVLLSNTNRALMKVALTDIEAFEGTMTDPVEERAATAGTEFIALPFVNVLQLDKLDDTNFVMLQRQANGNLALVTAGDRWL
ncbi:MAG TPA: hypothetical protein DCR93_38750 [Cytophagales bacterium]|nr:hypothetical protein [Cytophagales bacterium]